MHLPPAPPAIAARAPLWRSALALAALALLAACSPTPPTAAHPRDQPTEQRWIIGAISRDLANLADFAAAPDRWTDLPADAVAVRETPGVETGLAYSLAITLPGGGEPVRNDLRVAGSVWTPALYVPTVRALFARLKISPPAADDAGGRKPDAELLKSLAEPLTTTLEAENDRLSGWLQAHPLDAGGHEQAALLLGTLALRDDAGVFWDPRGLCNRATAHLAFARALRADASPCGEVAELLVGLLIDTKADCTNRIAALQTRAAAQPALVPWVRAAALRNTRDYRLADQHPPGTFLERRELFRAVAEAVSPEAAARRTTKFEPSTAPDWSRIVLEMNFGVDSGHRFARPSVGLEIRDASLVLPALRTAGNADRLAAVLNELPGDAVRPGEDHQARVRVIDRGTWARFFQRQLLHAANQTYHFMQDKWGDHETAKSFHDQVGGLLGKLTLYPLSLDYLGKPEGAALHPAAAALVRDHPEWVGEAAWEVVARNVPAAQAQGGSWRAVSVPWFSPAVPTGTAYGFYTRVGHPSLLPALGSAALEKTLAIAPLQFGVCWTCANQPPPPGVNAVEQYRRVMAPLMPYYLDAIVGEANMVKDDPARYGVLMNQAAAQEPIYYVRLGKYCVEHQMEPEAAQAYQAAIDHGADAVTVSNTSAWLVNYYFDHGERDRALTIANTAAEVYSSSGLRTLAELMERMNRLPEAESGYEKIKERYEDAAPLNAFYARHAATNADYARKAKAAESALFPDGLEPVAMSDLEGKPTAGVLVKDENDLSRRYGLRRGAIIVGLDGKRVRNMPQFTYVRALSLSPDMTLLVYHRKQYQEIKARVPGRLFGLDFATWP